MTRIKREVIGRLTIIKPAQCSLCYLKVMESDSQVTQRETCNSSPSPFFLYYYSVESNPRLQACFSFALKKTYGAHNSTILYVCFFPIFLRSLEDVRLTDYHIEYLVTEWPSGTNGKCEVDSCQLSGIRGIQALRCRCGLKVEITYP